MRDRIPMLWRKVRRRTHGGDSRIGIALARSGFFVAVLSLCVLTTFRAFSAPACEAPDSWPLGDHPGEFAIAGKPPFQVPGGWDPAFFPKHQSKKDALTKQVDTYHVGLPGSSRPSDLKTWTGSCKWNQSNLASSGMPTISLDGDDGKGKIDQVFLVAGYNMQGCTVWLDAGVKVAVWGSSFKDIRIGGAVEGVWIVDSLIDVDAAMKAPFRGGENSSSCKTHVLYSEQMGGLDVGKAHNMTYYRNHLHGSMKIDEGHADGLQINSSSQCAFIFENNVDFLFRMTNRALFLQNSNPMGIHNTWVVNNLISGGANSMNICGKTSDGAPRFGPCENSVICGNRTLADDFNVSWANPKKDKTKEAPLVINGGDGIIGDHYRENNGFYTGKAHRTTVKDNEGDVHTISNGRPVPASSKSEIDHRVAQMENWVRAIRAAAGHGPGASPE
jgi:hypothetical protein